MGLSLNKSYLQITNGVRPKNYSLIFYIVFISFIGINSSFAQTYFQSRTGYVHQIYKPLQPEVLNRNEHDYLSGFMLDFEVGKQIKRERVTFLFGTRLQQLKENVKGIYTKYEINPEADINVYRSSIFLTAGLKAPIIDKLNFLVQLNIGSRYTLWYQDGEFKESFWGLNLPIDIGLEYPINNNWNLIGGTSIALPIYISRTYIFYVGISKQL